MTAGEREMVELSVLPTLNVMPENRFERNFLQQKREKTFKQPIEKALQHSDAKACL